MMQRQKVTLDNLHIERAKPKTLDIEDACYGRLIHLFIPKAA